MPLTLVTTSKTSPIYHQDPRVRQIDTLQIISRAARDEYLGANWFRNVGEMYALKSADRAISFRPRVQIPQLLVLMLSETVDLSDSSPRIYLADKKGKRDEERERAFQQQWRVSKLNYHLLFTSLWAQLAGIGWIQQGYDPFMLDGEGGLWARHRSPDTVDIDPGCVNFEDCTYQILSDRLYANQLRYHFPEAARGIEAPSAAGPITPGANNILPIRMPEGPMSRTNVLTQSGQSSLNDGKLDVRYTFITDNTVEVVNDEAGSDAAKALKSIYRRAYPKGRYLCDANGSVVADGANTTPGGGFPAIPVYGLPALTNFYPPPPPRFSKDLEDLAGRFLTQIFENAVRLNNGVWFIDDNTGIDPEQFGGLPGEVQVISSSSRLPQAVWPQGFQPQVLELPRLLLNLQKELQGFNQSREGSPGAGNISGDLYEASIFQSKRLTRLRAKLLANSVQLISERLYGLMVQHFTTERVFSEITDEYAIVPWKPLGTSSAPLRVHLDEQSLVPISQAALRSMAPMLRQTQSIDLRSFLEFLEIPNAAEIAGRVKNEQLLAALNRLRKK